MSSKKIYTDLIIKKVVIPIDPLKTIKTIAAKYTHAQNVLTVTKRVERSRSIIIIKHKYMLMCNHKIRINIMSCLRNSTVRCEIGQLHVVFENKALQRYCFINIALCL